MFNDTDDMYLTDIDECKLASLNNTDLCSGVMQCVNTERSYQCLCPYGFTNTNGSCLSKYNLTLVSSCFNTCQLISIVFHTPSPKIHSRVYFMVVARY